MSETMPGLGLVLCDIREGKWHRRSERNAEVLKKFPQDSLLAMAMGRIQISLGDYKGAVATFEQIRNNVNQKRPGFHVLSPGEVNLRLALALLGLGRPRDAQTAVEKALQDEQATASNKSRFPINPRAMPGPPE